MAVKASRANQVQTLFLDCEPVRFLRTGYGLDVMMDDRLARQQGLHLERGDHADLVNNAGEA
jgi:hypothetical protein